MCTGPFTVTKVADSWELIVSREEMGNIERKLRGEEAMQAGNSI